MSHTDTPTLEHYTTHVFTIRQFCQHHNLSESFYFKLQRKGQGPRIMHVGKRVLISKEAAANWRAMMEAES